MAILSDSDLTGAKATISGGLTFKSSTVINDNLFEYAGTSKGTKVAYLPTEEAPKIVQLGTLDAIKAAPIFQPQQDKVFSQNPKAGTLVQRGTAVDIILVQQESATVGMVDATHADLGSQKLVQVYADVLEGNDTAVEVVDKYSKGLTLTVEDETLMNNVFAEKGITVVAGDRTKDFNAAMNTVSAALTLGKPVL
ncbi:MAG: hypothetical protein JSW26_00035 [Desulfobacterales bacterium]|nr:MAG: hypothetical protein JSW26_00035 [Desulfobacterales bacterium]